METKEKKTTNKKSKAEERPQKPSKLWLAMLANKGTGEIVDMKAVLK